jgi:acetyl esterase/lipase
VNLCPNLAPANDAQNDFIPTLDLYPIDAPECRGAVLICPGGGYANRADHEGKNIAHAFNAQGIHAFVVQYRVSPNKHPAPLCDVSRALRIIRTHANSWRVNFDRIAVCGFSAGGHLAASLGVHYDCELPGVSDETDMLSNRPDALILGYPVISAGEYRHKGSFNNLLGEAATQESIEFMSLEKQVTEKSPPTFLWHTAEDASVPPENSMLFAQALGKHNIPYELHVFPKGRHGLGLAPELPNVAAWFDLCVTWVHTMGWPCARV